MKALYRSSRLLTVMKLMSVWIGGCVRARIWSSFEHVSVPPNGNKIEKLKIMKKSVNDDDEGN